MSDEAPDAVDELMNLARHLHAESRTLGDHVRDAERGDGSELASAIYQSRADALMDAARHLHRTAKWMDGAGDRPAELAHGEELSGEFGGVPWRDDLTHTEGGAGLGRGESDDA